VFDEDLRTTAVGRLATERMVRRAIAEQRLRVHYQPIFDLRHERPVGAEALVRIADPRAGLLEASSFLEVAEESGQLAAIDEVVLAQAVQQGAAWHARFGADRFSGIAVNLSARHLADAGFANDVIGILDAEGLPHGHLKVEVTERVLMEASNSSMTGLRALRSAGVVIGLDDFGTGYSSLGHLRQFPLDFVKIDASIIHELALVPGEDAIVAAIVDLSHAFGLTAVAEGIEIPEQLETVRTVGCDLAQGFLLGHPGPPHEVESRLADGGAPLGEVTP
jgi:EAL domain-containing protein (putative c-di-GMP-specific phosphodiesterase class I)